MLDFTFQNHQLSKPSSNSSRRVQSWLDSMYYHHDSSFDENERFDKSSLASVNSTAKSSKTKNSTRKSISTSSSSFTNNQTARRIYLRKPRYLIARTRRNSKNKLINKNSDQSSSYLSNYSSTDESNLFSNVSTVNFLNDFDTSSPKLPTEIKADDLDFDSRNSLTSTESSCMAATNNYSSNNHSFGILDFERWESSLQLDDNLTFKVRTYAFDPKEIKIKVKENTLIVTGKQQIEEENGWFKREFKKKFELPVNADKKNIKYDFDKNDHLIITVPRTIHSVH